MNPPSASRNSAQMPDLLYDYINWRAWSWGESCAVERDTLRVIVWKSDLEHVGDFRGIWGHVTGKSATRDSNPWQVILGGARQGRMRRTKALGVRGWIRRRRVGNSLVRGDQRRGLGLGLSLSSQVGGHDPESQMARVQDYGSSMSLWPGVYIVCCQ